MLKFLSFSTLLFLPVSFSIYCTLYMCSKLNFKNVNHTSHTKKIYTVQKKKFFTFLRKYKSVEAISKVHITSHKSRKNNTSLSCHCVQLLFYFYFRSMCSKCFGSPWTSSVVKNWGRMNVNKGKGKRYILVFYVN